MRKKYMEDNMPSFVPLTRALQQPLNFGSFGKNKNSSAASRLYDSSRPRSRSDLLRERNAKDA